MMSFFWWDWVATSTEADWWFQAGSSPPNVYSLKLGETVSQVGIEQKHKKTLEEN